MSLSKLRVVIPSLAPFKAERETANQRQQQQSQQKSWNETSIRTKGKILRMKSSLVYSGLEDGDCKNDITINLRGTCNFYCRKTDDRGDSISYG